MATMLVAGLLMVCVACTNDGVGPLEFVVPPTGLVAGVDLDISGAGHRRRARWSWAQSEQVGVELIPIESPSGYDQLGSFDGEGRLGFIAYAGTVEVYAGHFVVDERGEWSGSLPVPDQLASGTWRLLATCLTLVDEPEAADRPGMPPAEGTTLSTTFAVP